MPRQRSCFLLESYPVYVSPPGNYDLSVRAEEFHRSIGELPYGKALPGAHYIFRPDNNNLLSVPFLITIKRAETAASPPSDWNLLKLHTTEFAVTFLSYPEFDTDPHPALAEATKINLISGRVTHTDYLARANPPILHRKETFLSPADPRVFNYAALTAREEEAGLYQDPSRIGLRVQWLALLKRVGFDHEGHTLVRKPTTTTALSATDTLEIDRSRTAIKRYDLSKPVKQLLERGLLRKGDSFFDFGCGHGMDIEALQNLGYHASGWDPAFRPNAPKVKATVVNLGYVLNVIEEPAERIATLRDAYSLAERLLFVSTMATGQETDAHSRSYQDGFLTKNNTFQKFYAPGELESLIESNLGAEVSTLGLGMCVVFRNNEDAELFEANRNRRRINWTEISTQFKFSAPTRRESRAVDRYELHKELFEEFWKIVLELGRLPENGDFDRLADVAKAGGGIKKAFALVISRKGEEPLQKARLARTEDVLVYLALRRFRERFGPRQIPLRIRYDIRSFFGDLAAAQAKADDLLFSAGDPDEIDLACENLDVGWQDSHSLMIHRSLLGELPPILRIYVYCAAFRYGDPAQADIIKIHKRSGKITFQHYDDFERKPLPELQTRIKVNLRSLFVEVFDHSKGPKTQLLFFKERFVASNHPARQKMERFSKRVRMLGLDQATVGLGPDKQSFANLLARARLDENLRPIREI
jgi:DNA phosphorothioation-associated putative methyltransferase